MCAFIACKGPENDAPRSSGRGRRPRLPRPTEAVAAAAAESASLAATEPMNLFIETGFGRFHPPAEFVDDIGSADHDIFDYDGLGIDSTDGYDFDLGITTAARAHPVERRVGNRHNPTTSLTVTAAGAIPILHPHPHHHREGPVVHSRNKRIRLWRKLYYLDFLRKLYAR